MQNVFDKQTQQAIMVDGHRYARVHRSQFASYRLALAAGLKHAYANRGAHDTAEKHTILVDRTLGGVNYFRLNDVQQALHDAGLKWDADQYHDGLVYVPVGPRTYQNRLAVTVYGKVDQSTLDKVCALGGQRHGISWNLVDFVSCTIAAIKRYGYSKTGEDNRHWRAPLDSYGECENKDLTTFAAVYKAFNNVDAESAELFEQAAQYRTQAKAIIAKWVALSPDLTHYLSDVNFTLAHKAFHGYIAVPKDAKEASECRLVCGCINNALRKAGKA